MALLVKKLQAANEAYRNTDKLLMTDEEYDRGLEELRRTEPNHPFLSQIGAMPTKAVVLPHTMASLDKILDSESLERWKKRTAASSYIVSEKLDGISCLYCVKDGKTSMYLRGDGVKGVDVSGLVGLVKTTTHELPTCMVRGELIITRADTPAGSIGRSLVNGWVHRIESARKELATVRFVAYELIQPAMSRKDQFAWLKDLFELPWYRLVAAAGLKENYLRGILQNRRQESAYATDGIVVASAEFAARGEELELKNPKDAIAFKVALDDQKAETVVVGVEWNLSRQGFLIPTILIEPVVIGEANIGRLSGHNAGQIYKNKIGPGARIIVRRSGDVIPTLDTVIQGVEPSMPAAWEWDATQVHAVAKVGSMTKEASAKALLHALQTLEIDGVGPGLVDKLVEAGLDTLKKCVDASAATLSSAVGPGRGPKLQEALRVKPSLLRLMIASNLLPRGVGERKLKPLFEIDEPSKWTFEKLSNVNGWGSIGIQDLLKAVPSVLKWCSDFTSEPIPSGPGPTASLSDAKGTVVFTGVRDKNLEGRGWTLSDTVTKKTNLVVTDDKKTPSMKTKKAEEYGIRIMTITEFREMLALPA